MPLTVNDFKDPGPVALASEEKPCGTVNLVKPATPNPPPPENSIVKPSVTVSHVKPIDASKPNDFTWRNAEAGNWSEAAKWTDNLTKNSAPAKAGQPDCILNFTKPGAYAVKNDLQAGFILNRLVLGDNIGGTNMGGNAVTFAKNGAAGTTPAIHAGKCQRFDINMPVKLQDNLEVNTVCDKDPNCFISFNEVISGPGALSLNSSGDSNVPKINFHDVHFGILQLNNSNTYTGGTRISGGKINVRKNDGLGTGPITIDTFGTLTTESGPLANPLTVRNGTLFHASLSGPINLDSNLNLISNCELLGPISGSGGIVMLGTNGTYLNMIPGGTVTLGGSNTYTGPTTVFPGTLIVAKATGLYNGDPAKWTPANITIHKAATLGLHVGGPGEFTGAQVGTLLANLTSVINDNGLMGGSTLCLDTSNAKEPITVSANISDSKGPGGGPFLIRKCGIGTIKLTGKNTYTGQTIIEGGGLSVSSFNSYAKGKGKPASSMGAPMDIEAGEIVIGNDGKDGDCQLIYTGPGETTDRVINLAGKKETVAFDQSGTGLLKFANSFIISGYGADKTIALTGDTAGKGEIAGNIINPHDRAGKAMTSVTKSGTGTWTFSGTNTYTGTTTVTQGTLSLANPRSLSDKSEIHISSGATLELNFEGEMRVGKLYLDGKLQPAGKHDAKNAPTFIRGSGKLMIQAT